MTCPATLALLTADERTEVSCDLDAGHDGPHEAQLDDDKWKGVIWSEGTTHVRAPGRRRR